MQDLWGCHAGLRYDQRSSLWRAHSKEVSFSSIATGTDEFEWLKKILSAIMRQVQRVITGRANVTVATLGGQPETHILGETFYSQAPVRFGDIIAKIAVAPISSELTALIQAPLNVNGVPNGLREAVVDFFRIKWRRMGGSSTALHRP